ncbi:MAG: MarR family transcriptional regulator [Pseudarcicella sp.]|nr:MarR family transcriptional regulator [Pseudarcicella sp.]MBP6410457.1 MarR family transcriptional regulator [Pseudarcicella sp.]
MKIEDELKQQNFINPHNKALVNIIFTNNWLMNEQNNLLKPFGISPQQYNVLRILRGQKATPLSINTISERMLDRMSNVSRLVDKLYLSKLVSRKESKKDRRSVDVKITQVGLDLLSEIDVLQNKMTDNLKNISNEEATLLSDLLDRIRTN